jgi:replicative DNA helicase
MAGYDDTEPRRGLRSVHISDTVEPILAELRLRAEFPNVTLTQSGLANLDEVVWLDYGTLTVVAARPGVGKTVLGAQLARQWAVEGEVWLYVTEMTIQDWVLRLVAAHAQVSFTSLRKAPTAQAVAAAERALEELAGLSIRFVQCAGWGINDVIAHARKGAATLGQPRGIIVDNLGGLTTQAARRSDRDLWFGDIIKQLAILRLPDSEGGIGAPVVAIHHLNRDGAGGLSGTQRPASSSLAGSDQIERDADTLLLLHRLAKPVDGFSGSADGPDWPAGTTHEAIVAKNRFGEPCVLPLRFVGEELRFEDPAGARPQPYTLPEAPSGDAVELRRRLAELPKI